MSTFFDFGYWHKKVPAHRHPNGGGWVADTATVAETAYVGPDARVFGSARVSGSAQVFGGAWVFGSARVSGSARVFGSARVSCSATVFGSAQVSGNAQASSAADILTGYTGGHDWTAYRCSRGWRLRYGCEAHPLSEWRRLHVDLAIKHTGSAEHAEYTRAVEASVRLHLDTMREAPNAK